MPGASTNHKGIDLTAAYGTAILASASGTVTTSTHSNSAGNYIVIEHGNGISTVYMHCSALLVSVGDIVEQGEVIGKVGSTGYSSGIIYILVSLRMEVMWIHWGTLVFRES